MRFSENLKVLRKNNGMTQKELSQALGVALSTVAMWETGNRKPDLEMLRTRPEVKMLFSASKNASKEDIERTVAIIEALKQNKR